jgi:diadenosine tetraphosphatase ApaH/serine/threonine PP2A family protein phosphatase
MTIWAIFSDVHGRAERLARVLDQANSQGAEKYLSLGDVGGEHALTQLTAMPTECVFGNWEASGLRGLPVQLRRAVNHWQPSFCADNFCAAHASPVWPDGLEIAAIVSYLRDHQLAWQALFPSLHDSEAARRAAFEALAERRTALFFHGHTHVQEIWQHVADAPPGQYIQRDFEVSPGSRYLVGVGSVGQPRDAMRSGYCLYDSEERRVRLVVA